MRKSMLILLLAWWLVAPAWGAELPREVRDALPAVSPSVTFWPFACRTFMLDAFQPDLS